jgi:hypothetical protein
VQRAPAAALDPANLAQQLAVMPFRTRCVRPPGGVMSTLRDG